ncbi:MAG: tripartite tricarboxylate transporter TctB family protein [Pseudomonadota bacterium]
MNKADRWIGLLFALFSTYICSESWKLGLGTFHRPGPGFLSFCAAIVLGTLSLSLVSLGSFRNREDEAAWKSWGRISLVVLAIFGFTLLLEKLGFLPSAFLFIFFLLKVVERRRWGFAVGVALLIAVASYAVFDVLLKAQLPEGLLER